jgi:hypothetical protein
MKICATLEISLWEALIDPKDKMTVSLSKKEINILKSYRNSPQNIQDAIQSILKTTKNKN